MKFFIVLSLLFIKQMSCAYISATTPARNECVEENYQLRLKVADLIVENDNLKQKLLQMSERNHEAKPRAKRATTSFMNCSSLSYEAEYLSHKFEKLSAELKDFNLIYAEQLTESSDETATAMSSMNCDALLSVEETISKHFKTLSDDLSRFKSLFGKQVEETVCHDMPKKVFESKFIGQTLYEKVCDVKKSNGEWTVIQRRIDGSVNFYRGWNDYKVGFGIYTGEFFIGLDNLHMLTTCAPQELMIEMEDYQNEKRYAQYDLFLIGDESEKYKMKELGNYKGNAEDSLRWHKSQMFTTFDQDNDRDSRNCAKKFKGAWWYNACQHSNLNGEYGNNKYGKGINWRHWHGNKYSLKKVEMKIRPKN